MASDKPAVVIGGGFFGCELAVRLARRFDRVVLLEAGDDLLTRASFHNQARVHGGYHYPRSMLTALRSRRNYPRFKADYAECIHEQFVKHYAIPKKFSKVSAAQFAGFCRRIGAPCRPVYENLFNSSEIESAFVVDECAFDAAKLRDNVRKRLQDAYVQVHLGSRADRLRSRPGGTIEVNATSPSGRLEFAAAGVFICVYSAMNQLLTDNGLPPVALKHELTEIALIEVPPELRGAGVTVMCGPFFSCMPFPARGLHSLSHVRFTPHCELPTGRLPETRPATSFSFMVRDASRYVPALHSARYVDSLWEVKTVLAQSEADDSRPVMFLPHHGMANLHCILGGKIDNIYDALDHVEAALANRRAA
jgi:glycine/D-amino acid oxidase-like deaminating enzyme